jgi:hypothetical protein
VKRGEIAIFNSAARDECALVNNAHNTDAVIARASRAHQTSYFESSGELGGSTSAYLRFFPYLRSPPLKPGAEGSNPHFRTLNQTEQNDAEPSAADVLSLHARARIFCLSGNKA